MLNFQQITAADAELLRRYYEHCEYRICEYSAAVKLMWTDLRGEWAEAGGCLLVKLVVEGAEVFDYPVAGDGGDEEAALCAVEEYCMQRELRLVWTVVPEEKLGRLTARYPYLRLTSVRTWQDYLYRTEDMQNFAGRRYSGQRNHIRHFRTLFPGAVFRPLTEADRGRVEAFWDEFSADFDAHRGRSAADELRMARAFFSAYTLPWLCAGGMELDGKLIGLSLGELCGSTLMVHIEKALPQYEGLYPAIVQGFAGLFGGEALWFNRQDDAASRGLRTSKLQYQPASLVKKYRVEPENEARDIEALPAFPTERLTLRPLEERDLPAYNALCLDDERNRWWGYDYRQDLSGPWTETFFLDTARRDFAKRTVLNFAVCLDDALIGEALIYHFDHKGGAELGCRILPAYAGQGFGMEAFAALKDWSLYRLGLTLARAKCYRENEPSRRMLENCMRKSGEDETFLYFEATV